MSLYTMMAHAWFAQCVYVATKLGVFDAIAERPKSLTAIAQEVGAHESSLREVLAVLGALNVVTQTEGEFGLTDMSREIISTDRPLREYILLCGEQLYPAFAFLLPAVRDGRTAFEHCFGNPVWAHYARDADASGRFAAFMDHVTREHAPTIAQSIECDDSWLAVDVGGGRGSLMLALLAAHPQMHGTVFDQPSLAADAMRNIATRGLAGRCSFVGGSFLDSVPPGGDLYIIRFVLHDWPDEAVARILRNVRAAITTGRLVLIESVLDDTVNFEFVVARTIEQHAWTGGRVRALWEWDRLLREAGFQSEKADSTPIPGCSLIYARPA